VLLSACWVWVEKVGSAGGFVDGAFAKPCLMFALVLTALQSRAEHVNAVASLAGFFSDSLVYQGQYYRVMGKVRVGKRSVTKHNWMLSFSRLELGWGMCGLGCAGQATNSLVDLAIVLGIDLYYYIDSGTVLLLRYRCYSWE
jgi:hypothetical protein